MLAYMAWGLKIEKLDGSCEAFTASLDFEAAIAMGKRMFRYGYGHIKAVSLTRDTVKYNQAIARVDVMAIAGH